MTVTLLVLAMIAAANPFRALAARPAGATRSTVGAALGATLALAAFGAGLAGPLLDLIDVSGPNAEIAAGVALLVVALKDVFLRPPTAEPALPGWMAGLVPLAFPVMFTPAFALLVVAGSSERGVIVALAAVLLALLPVGALLLLAPAWRSRAATSTLGIAGAGTAAFVVLDGVYAI